MNGYGFVLRCIGASAFAIGRMVFLLAVAGLLCTSVAYGQVVGEGGFPVKGGSVSGESFSLICPSRLAVQAGSSIALSCSATAVPEEGVRYEWEAVSGDGFHLLSASDELSPLFTAPLSGESAEYVYRLTAMSVGVYETATLTVVVGGVWGETVGTPVVREDCDPFTVPGEFGESCAEDKGPVPFGFGPESEGGFLFPEAPGLPDRPSGPVRGGGFDRQAPPRLECPVAVFLDELETGAIECRAWDASGGEYLEYVWEPVGSTTRDYLGNPRLIPEDSPTPSVVAPEAPVHETLESFHSGETTFRYRYRLTATSRATGLSSWQEVEVYVSSSRPSVYCPLEVVVEEGSTVALDCDGVDPLSFRMDYDEDGASIEWEWEGLWGTSTGLLDATDRSSPLFTAPVGSAGEEYHYIASMTSSSSGMPRTARRRVTVRVAGREEGGQNAVKVTAQNVTEEASGMPADISCVVFVLDSLYEGDPDKQFNCTITPTGGDQLLSVTWTWEDPYDPGLLSATNIPNPFFHVPDNVSETTRYDFYATAEYQLASGPVSHVVNVYAIVNNLEVVVACDDPGSVEEGSLDIDFSCSAQHRDGSSGLTWSWSPTTRLTGHNTGTPTFDVPADVDGDETWTYTVTVSAPNSDPGEETVTVKVRDADMAAPSVRCTNARIYEGSGDITLSCSVTNEPAGAAYAWTGTDIADRLTGTGSLAPTFDVPDNVDSDTDYDYTVTLSASGIDDITEDVTVTVLEKPDITWCGVNTSSDYSTVWEGSGGAVFSFGCIDGYKDLRSPQGAPSGSNYTYAWSTRGDTPATAIDLLQGRNKSVVSFSVPSYGTVDEDQTYEFRLTISAANADDAIWDWTVIVKNSKVTVTCDDPDDVYEGEMAFDFSCSAAGPPGSTYTWSWYPTTDLTDHTTGMPTFAVPGDVYQDTTYAYTVTASAANAEDGTAEVTVTVLEKPDIYCPVPSVGFALYAGRPDYPLLVCEDGWKGAPVGSDYAYVWTARGGTANTDLLGATGMETPMFDIPDAVESVERYYYTLTVSAANADAASVDVEVSVWPGPSIACADPDSVYEGSGALTLSCSAENEPTGATYSWSARGSTSDTSLLTGTNGLSPVFAVPNDIPGPRAAFDDERYSEVYEYSVAIRSAGVDVASADVSVTVLEKPDLVCLAEYHGFDYEAGIDETVYEGSPDFRMVPCPTYWIVPPTGGLEFAWTGSAEAMALVEDAHKDVTRFLVPADVDEDETYEYLFRAQAGNFPSDPYTLRYTMTVLNKRPLSVVCADPGSVYEGSEDFAMDCRALGVPAGSSYKYEWAARGDTPDLLLFSNRRSPSPTFFVPSNVDEDETYEYTLTVSAQNAEDATADVTVTVLNKPALSVVCADPGSVYEGSAPFDLNCSASGAPGANPVYSYVWSARGDTPDLSLLTGTSGPAPTFAVPSNVDADETYEYRLTASADNAEDAVADVTVTVLNKPALSVVCAAPGSVYEGSAPFDLNCAASGAPGANPVYSYVWSARGDTPDLSLLTGTSGPAPTFAVPSNVDADETYEYRLTASADNADDATADVTVTVLNKRALSVVCAAPGSVYEGSAPFDLDCVASGAPVGSVYSYVWSARGDASDLRSSSNTSLSLLTGTSGPAPTFSVPLSVNSHETYEYTLTASADNAEDATADVTVTVLDKGALSVACASPPLVYEGSAPFDLNCAASGAPGANPVYSYVWSARGDTPDLSLLTGTSGPAPTFAVPSNVDADETYEYRLTVSAQNADDATADVTVTVLNKRALSVVCADPGSVYEGSAPFDLDCVASGAPVGSVYSYVWSARGDASDLRPSSNTSLSLLTGTSGPAPTFSVPLSVNSHETYEYTLTASADNAEDATADVTVTVLDKGALAVACASPPLVYEGSAPFDLNCSASGAPGANPVYSYVWSARGDTPDLSLLTGTSGPAPTFAVPSNVDADETYEYRLTASADNADDATADVTVTVLNKRALSVVCADPGSVYEGSAPFDLDCVASGAPVGSVYSYVWSARGDASDLPPSSNTSLSLLTGTSGPAPTFSVPLSVNSHETYEYTLTASADNAEDATADVTVTVLDKGALSVACAPPPLVYEGSAPFDLNCAASGAPGANPVYSYVWSARGDTPDLSLLTGTSGPAPTFAVPSSVNGNETYEYTLTVSAANAEDATADVTVTVLDKGALSVACAPPPLVYEGSAPFDLNCAASGAPGANPVYSYVWSARGDTPDLSLLTGTSGPAPTFSVPSSVNGNETYEYRLTVSADNAEDATADVTVTVLDKGALSVACASPPLVYEGSAPFDLNCAASGAPGANPVYSYVWSARGDTPDLSLLTGTNGPAPTFAVPSSVNGNETYEYTLTVSAANAEDATADVTVTVLDKGALSVACAPPPLVYEGSAPFDLNCAASGAPGANPVYSYVWSARGDTPDLSLLTGTSGPAPTFSVPSSVNGNETYEYRLTVSADNAEDATADVTVTVLSKGALAVVCADPGSVYEGAEDVAFDCTASGAPAGSVDTYMWTARGDTPDTALLSAADIASPTFYVPDEVDGTTAYEYLLTVSADNTEDATVEVTVTVLNLGALAVVCTDPGSVYEGEDDVALDCAASGAPAGSVYTYAWTARGDTPDTALLNATDISSPVFSVPDEVDEDETYQYLLTVSADNAEDATAEVTVTVLNLGALAVVCTDPGSVYEGEDDFALDCAASGAPAGSVYTYAWTARGDTPDTALLNATDISSPVFSVPDEVDEDETHQYLLTVSADNTEDATVEVTVTVLNRGALAVVCADPGSVYEGAEDVAFDCTASGAPAGSVYTYAWTARGDTPDTALLNATDISSPVFSVPDEVDEDETHQYLLTVSADNTEDATVEVTVTVLNRGALAVVCADPGSVYEGAEDVAFDCTASGAPAGSVYTYAWTARGDTPDTALLNATDISSPVFSVPDEVDEDETYQYLLTVSADNAEDATAAVAVTVLDRAPLAFLDDSISGRVYVFTVGESIADILLPQATGGLSPYTYTLAPALPPGLALDDPTRTISGTPLEVSPRSEYTWQAADVETVQIAFFIEVVPAADTTSPPVAESSPLAESSSTAPTDPTALGVTVSASPLLFGVQSAVTEVSLDPVTDGISTRVSGPYHAGRMTLSPGGSAAFDENGEMALSIELASPVVLRREGGIEGALIVLSPVWSFAESCEQLSSQSIGSLYTEVTLSEEDCRLLRFGGDLDLIGALPGLYSGRMDIVLRSGEREETHSVEVEVTVVAAQRVITIGPGGVRFSTSRELPAGLTEEQNLSIYPDLAFLTEEKPNGAFELSNPSLIPLEVTVSARFGYTEAAENGREVVVEDTEGSPLADLSQVVDIYPGVVVLMPGEKGLVRYGVQEGALAAMSEKGYAAFFDVVSSPRQYVRSDRMPEEVSGDRTARVTIRIPGVYVPGEGASQLRATLLSISFVGSLSATFLLETQDHPFVGEVLAYDGDGRELGRRETLVYTRSRVRVPLDRMPDEEAVFLRFVPRGSSRVPGPVNIPWNAPFSTELPFSP